MDKKIIRAALLGFGTVGTGVYKVLQKQKEDMIPKLGSQIEIKKILVRNLEKAAAKVEDPAVNFDGERLVYIRQKTKKLIMLPLQEKAVEIVNRYRSSQRKYVFPVLDNRERTPRQIRNRIYDVLDNVNGYLADIGKELGIELKISSYVARHSYATVLKRSGVSTSVISESLGHSSERVTQIYLDSFENRQLNDAMKNLL